MSPPPANTPRPEAAWLPALALGLCLGAMACLRAWTLHASYYDLGVFEHAIWALARGQWQWLFYGHAQFLLPLDALAYALVPHTFTLLAKQALVLGLCLVLVRRLVPESTRPGLPLWAFALYFPVWYLALFDFHPEHMAVPLGLSFFWACNKGRFGWATACAVGLALTKEPLALAGVFYGLYLAARFRRWGWAAACVAACVAIFWIDKAVLIPAFTYDVGTDVYRPAFAWMGRSLADILAYMATHPLELVREVLGRPEKLVYCLLVLGGLAFLPLLSPLELIPALPVLAISLLSRNPNYYGYAHHYTAGLVAPFMAAACLGLARAGRWSKAFGLPRRLVPVLAACCLLVVHVAVSPSPASRLFWTDKVFGYGHEAYVPTPRQAMIRAALAEYVPADPSVTVCAQNTVYQGWLARREVFEVFPRGVTTPSDVPVMDQGGRPYMDQVDYLVLDLKRPWYLEGDGCRWRSNQYGQDADNPWLGCAPPEFRAEFMGHVDAARQGYDLVFERDGFMILQAR